jgi:hypothetical protein
MDDRRPPGRWLTGLAEARGTDTYPPAAFPAAAAARPAPPPIDITPAPGPPPTAGRRRRVLLLAAGVVAALVAGGAGYAAAAGPDRRTPATVLPSVPPPAMPFGAGPAPLPAGPPAAEAVTPSPARSATPSPARSATATPVAPSATAGTSAPPATVALPDRPLPQPPAATGPPWRPPPAEEPQPTPTAPRLTARLSGGGEWITDGLIGYGGTVRLDNSGRRAATGWRVTVTVPAGNPVEADGPVSVTRDGDRVTFAPGGPGAEVPPGGSFTFTFRIGGVLPAPPDGCTVNGHTCS